jgi:hypothetical protein
MRSIALLTVTLCLLAGVAGCGSSSDSDPGGDAGDPDVVYLRGLNAVSNGPDLPDSEFFTLYVSDELPDAGALPPAADIVGRDLRYSQMSDYLGLATGTSYLTLTERFYETDTEAPDATESITIGPLPFEALGGQVSTLLILPGQTGATEDMLLLDDLAP